MLKACVKRAIQIPISSHKGASLSRLFVDYKQKTQPKSICTFKFPKNHFQLSITRGPRDTIPLFRKFCSTSDKNSGANEATEVKVGVTHAEIISDAQTPASPQASEGQRPTTWDENNEFVIEENGKSMVLRMDRKENGETFIEVRLPGSDVVQRWEPIPEKAPFKDADFLCLGEYYNPETEPYGWWMCEKYDGTRGYWDGHKLYNRTGGEMKPPKEFIDQLPQGIPIDGELWTSYCSQHLVNKLIHQGVWDRVKYMVFDAPGHKGTFEERMEFLKENIKPNLPQVKLVELKKCEGKHHMIKSVDDLVVTGGEGIILRQPGSPYTIGRCQALLKVKPQQAERCVVIDTEKIEIDAKGMDKRKNLLVKNKLGRSYHLRFKVSQRTFPFVALNSVISVRYSGFATNGSPRFPIIKDHHQLVKWENVYTWWVDVHSRFDVWNHCLGCQKKFSAGDVRVQTKGIIWMKEGTEHEPPFGLFQFCPEVKCIRSGIENSKKFRYEFPTYNNKIAIKEEYVTHFTPEQKIFVDNLKNEGVMVVEEYPEMSIDDDVYDFEPEKKADKGRGRRR